jgi:hypothetical protein
MSVTEIPELRIELGPAAEAIQRAGRRLADLLAMVDEPDRGVRGLEWTLRELVAHLAARSGRFAAYLSGAAVPEGEIAGIAEENRHDVDEPGVMLDVATASGLLLGELIVHGYDAARTLGRPWPIAGNDARTMIRAMATLAPWYVDPDATRGDRTTYRVVVRGGPAFRVRVDDGTASIEPAKGDADCTIRAEPSALILLSYGRITPWRGVAKGRFVPRGRRPWRALRFARSFLPP